MRKDQFLHQQGCMLHVAACTVDSLHVTVPEGLTEPWCLLRAGPESLWP